jgi:hypothetical protein
LRRGDEGAVDLAMLDRVAGRRLVGIPVDLEGAVTGLESVLDRRGADDGDRHVTRLEPGAGPCEQRDHQRHGERDDEDRRGGGTAMGSGRGFHAPDAMSGAPASNP